MATHLAVAIQPTMHETPVVAIDHVLATEEFQAMSTRTVTVSGTDHLALLAKLRFSKPG